MPFIAPVVAAVVAAAPAIGAVAGATTAVFGAVNAAKGQKGGGGAPAAPGAPSAPNPAALQASAQEEASKKRRVGLSTGGQTDLTGGTGYIDPSNIQRKNLLGS